VTGQHSARKQDPTSSRDDVCFDVVVIGASAGGVYALETVLRALPDPFPVPVAVVLHLSPDHESVLAQVLTRITGRRVEWATNGAKLVAGAIVAAPPDRHLEVDDQGSVVLATTPRVHFSRPSLDHLFVSAARTFGPRALAVILTGNGSDGTDGALAVRDAGGVVIAQDEASSEYFNMPREVISAGAATLVLPLNSIPAAITRLVLEGRGVVAELSSQPPNAPPATHRRRRDDSPIVEPRSPGS
jgi:two-component system chemotaxis response regulator CheB